MGHKDLRSAFFSRPGEKEAFSIAGYQVCDKWIKCWGKRRLELHDIRTYCRMAMSVKFIMNIPKKINAL
jgi:hypothetical protein